MTGGQPSRDGLSTVPLTLLPRPLPAQPAAGIGPSLREGGGDLDLRPPETLGRALNGDGEPCVNGSGAGANQPVASVSTEAIALRRFRLRFRNDEIEAM